MDDPWANAWGEPATKTKQPPPPVFPAQAGDDEEDITIPTWEPPSWQENNSNSLWGARSPTLDKFPSWHSPYDDLPLGKSSVSLPDTTEVPETHSDDGDEQEDVPDPEPEPAHEPAPELAPESPVEPPFEPPVSSPILPPNSPPGSPDAFGTFETGLDDLPSTSDDPWSPSRGSFVPHSTDAAWGTAWAPSDVEQPAEDVREVVDEWEAAKQQKALQDKHVPPELLASLLLQFTELANELYPPLPTHTPDPDDYRASRHKGLQGIDSLNPTVMRLLPTDLTLSPPRPFLKSATAKHATEALRLSRSAAFVRCSPLSYYSATKGSTAWEASVKRRPEAVGDADLLPPGWRIVETKPKEDAVTDKKKTGHGGLLSFFGRRAGTPPVSVSGEGATPRSASPASASSPRASLDSSAKSPTSTSSTKSPTITSAATSAAPSAAVSPTASSGGVPPQPPSVAPVISQTDSGAETDPVTPVSAPSAVSRFLGRFGRKAPAAGGRQGLALSEGDFDFLADIEGAAAAGPSSGSDTGIGSFAISGALLDEPVPLPAKLAPPPRPSVSAAAFAPQKSGDQGRAEIDADADELAIFGKYTPPPPKLPPVKPLAPPLAPSVSAPPSAPKTMSPVDSDIDFSAWGFDDEDKIVASGVVRRESEPVAGTNRPPTRQVLNTRAATNARGAVPPPRRVPTAIMSSGPSKPPAAIPKLDATFGFPPPPRTQTQTPILTPPPGTKTPAKPALLDDDDFSDFHAPAQIAPPTASATSFYESFSSSTSSDRGLFSSTSSTSIPANLFDDFDDFMQASPQEPTTLRTPSPPRPPAKTGRIPPPAPLSVAPPQPDHDDTPLALIAQESRVRSSRELKRATNHQRALSLVESAAASSGVRWPAPPSPVPEALPPPPNHSDPFGFNGGSTMQSQQAAFMRAPLALKAFPPPPSAPAPIRALSPPVLSPPPQPQKVPAPFPPPLGAAPIRTFSPPAPSRTPMLLPPPQNGVRGFPPPMPTATPTPPPMTSTASGKSSGGLSAQDLSFFEGL